MGPGLPAAPGSHQLLQTDEHIGVLSKVLWRQSLSVLPSNLHDEEDNETKRTEPPTLTQPILFPNASLSTWLAVSYLTDWAEGPSAFFSFGKLILISKIKLPPNPDYIRNH